MSDASQSSVATGGMSDAEMEAALRSADGESTVDPVTAASMAKEVGGAGVLEAMEPGKTVVCRGQGFKMVDELPGMLMLQLTRLEDPKMPLWKKSSAMVRILEAAIVADEREDWMELLESAEPPIGMEELTALISKVVEHVVGRPTGPPSA